MSSKIAITVGVLITISLLGLALFLDSSNTKISEATGLVVNLQSFPVYMETHPLLKDLPNDSSISLIIGGQAYGISGKEIQVDRVVKDADISIELPSGYESRIGEIGLCSAVKEALQKGDLKFETSISKTKLLMKYYKLIKYKECVEA